MFSPRSKRALLAGAIAAITLLPGCGGDTNSSTPNSPATATTAVDFNDQDVTFATDMIGHHRQAVEMAELVPDREASTDVAALAAKIEAAQTPEIATMVSWLEAWGEPVPDEGMMEHDAGSMPGMMSHERMAELESSTAAAFDKLFLQMMIEHHEGAITMAKAEQTGGENGDAKALADRVIADQTAEIATMRKLL